MCYVFTHRIRKKLNKYFLFHSIKLSRPEAHRAIPSGRVMSSPDAHGDNTFW